jgi:H+-transporting ATPase
MNGAVRPPGPIPASFKPEDFAIFAGNYAGRKFNLVRTFQKDGHTVGMCGDGAHDAPALRQAQLGISVSTAPAWQNRQPALSLPKPALAALELNHGALRFYSIGAVNRIS